LLTQPSVSFCPLPDAPLNSTFFRSRSPSFAAKSTRKFQEVRVNI
jgi:hypothetical protein